MSWTNSTSPDTPQDALGCTRTRRRYPTTIGQHTLPSGRATASQGAPVSQPEGWGGVVVPPYPVVDPSRRGVGVGGAASLESVTSPQFGNLVFGIFPLGDMGLGAFALRIGLVSGDAYGKRINSLHVYVNSLQVNE